MLFSVYGWCCPEVADCVPNRNASGVNSWQTGRDCPIRMRKGASRARVGRHKTTSASCVLKNLLRPSPPPSPPRFHDSIIKDSPDRTPTFQQHMNSLPVSLGDNYRSSCETVAVYINMSSDYYSTILNNYSTCHPNLGYYCLPLHCPACSPPYDPICI